MQSHFRCPLCGQQRPEKSFLHAGQHRLEALYLRGQGHGKGFARFVQPLTVAMLDFLAEQLDRARGQVEHLRTQAAMGVTTAPLCPHCGWSLAPAAGGWACSGCGAAFR